MRYFRFGLGVLMAALLLCLGLTPEARSVSDASALKAEQAELSTLPQPPPIMYTTIDRMQKSLFSPNQMRKSHTAYGTRVQPPQLAHNRALQTPLSLKLPYMRELYAVRLPGSVEFLNRAASLTNLPNPKNQSAVPIKRHCT